MASRRRRVPRPRHSNIIVLSWQPFRVFISHATSANVRCVSLGKDVRRRRLALGLTLEQVAEKARLSPNYVGSVEMGRRDPSLSTVLALARALRIPPGDLLGGAQALEGPALEAARLVASLPGEVQEPLLALLRSLARKRR